MTQNFVNYLNYRESVRTNKANEMIRSEANQIQRTLGFANLAETSRHNIVTEVETNRHNVAFENETKRHNLATETETARHNKSAEGIQLANLNLEASKIQETKRHNLSTESISANVAENNLRVALGQIGLGYANLSELQRSNLANENIKYSQLSELNRHNIRSENLGYEQYNLALSEWSNRVDVLNETIRHNKAVELENVRSTDIRGYNTLLNTLVQLSKLTLSFQ